MAEQRTVNPYSRINSMKKCSLCHEEKDESLFNKKDKKRLQPYCRPCDNKKSRERYAIKGVEHSKIVYERTKRVRAEMREFVNKIKETTPCADCGNYFPPYVLDHDHVEGDKVANIAKIVSQGLGMKKLTKELKKCEVVCSNCHRIRTHARKNIVS